MYLSIKEYNEIIEIADTIKNNIPYNEYKEIKYKKILELFSVMADVKARHEKSNSKIALYIAEKRKTDKNYARSKK